MEEKSKILIIGGTGYIGKYIVEASVRLGHPTFALIREATATESGTEKAKLIETFKKSGVILLYGDIQDQEILVEAIRKVDVVISILGHKLHKQLADQVKIISAIKEAGTVKRYFPSEFGLDVGRVNVLEPAKTALGFKARIREMIKDEGIPYTFVSCNFFAAGHFLPRIGQVEAEGLPIDKIFILGDGNARVVLVREEDIGTYTIKAADDPRAANKILYMRPQANIISHNELISLWEKKTGKTFERIYIPEEDVIKKIQESPPPLAFIYAIAHSAFVKGQVTNFDIDQSIGVEASEIYPEIQYSAVDELLDQLA